jgi:hypothetical protein
MRGYVALISICACLAVFVCFVSTNLYGRYEHRNEVIRNQFAILHGQPHIYDGKLEQKPQFQSRVLFPLLLAGAARVVPVRNAYLLLRLLTAFAAFVVFALAVTAEGAGVKTASFGAGVLAYGLTLTFNHAWEHPTDFFDVLFFSLLTLLTLRHRRLAFILVTLAATLNHQTAAFAGVMWLCVWGLNHRKVRWDEAVCSAGVSLGSYVGSTAIKSYLGTPSISYVVNGWLTFPQLMEGLRHPHPSSWLVLLVAMLLPLWMWLRSNSNFLGEHCRRLLWAAVAIVVLSSPIAFWAELRSVFLAPYVILTFAATAGEAKASASSGD